MQFVVEAEEAGTRLDHLVAARAGCSRAAARRLIDEGAVRVDGARGKKGARVQAGERVELRALPADAAALRPVPDGTVDLVVLHVDEALVCVAKPAGVATHPLRAGERGTLANALVARFPECAAVSDDPREGGVAHRLDVDTSGVLIAARTRDDWLALRRAFSTGQVDKDYWALVAGAPPSNGEVDAPIAHARDPRRVKTMVEPLPDGGDDDAKWFNQSGKWLNQSVRGAPRPARTEWVVLARGKDVALVRARASTGRMHQVRAHLAHAGHPLVGDALYGGPPLPGGAGGHFLHAARIVLPHPRTGRRLVIHAPLPPERSNILAELVDWAEDSPDNFG